MIAAALNPIGHTHFTDHLAAVCVVMDMPLIFCDEQRYQQARRLYPGLKVELHDYQELTPRAIVESYEAVFVSEMWTASQIEARFGEHQAALGKRLRMVHCPHGFSDKGFWFALCPQQDLTLVYGQNMLDLIDVHHEEKPEWDYVVVGNLRQMYYRQHHQHFDSIVEKDVFSQFSSKQKVILYAPTWRDSHDSTSFFSAAEEVLKGLPDDYNLLVKLHPNLENDEDLMLEVYRVIAEHEQRPNVVFLSDYPLIYPLLERSDIYLGDLSAVGYDFVSFGRPMFFLNDRGLDPEDRSTYLFRCGHVIAQADYSRVFECIAEGLKGDFQQFDKVRKEVCSYTFAPDQDFSKIREKVLAHLR